MVIRSPFLKSNYRLALHFLSVSVCVGLWLKMGLKKMGLSEFLKRLALEILC